MASLVIIWTMGAKRAQHTLEIYDFTLSKVQMLEEMIQRHVESQHGKLLDQCGLGPILRAIRSRPPDVRALTPRV